MGFIKRSDGDTDHVIDRVFEDMDEVMDVIAENTLPDEPPAVVEIPGDGPPSDEKANCQFQVPENVCLDKLFRKMDRIFRIQVA